LRLPIGVRTASTITASRIIAIVLRSCASREESRSIVYEPAANRANKIRAAWLRDRFQMARINTPFQCGLSSDRA
jgi:hypothetical protein